MLLTPITSAIISAEWKDPKVVRALCDVLFIFQKDLDTIGFDPSEELEDAMKALDEMIIGPPGKIETAVVGTIEPKEDDDEVEGDYEMDDGEDAEDLEDEEEEEEDVDE